MKLRAISPPESSKSVPIRFSATGYEDVQTYRQFYADTAGSEITFSRITAEIVRQFLESDRDFQRWRRDRKELAPAQTAPGADGRGASAPRVDLTKDPSTAGEHSHGRE